jgi:predicted RNA methylase
VSVDKLAQPQLINATFSFIILKDMKRSMDQQLLNLANVIRERFKGQQHRPVPEQLALDMCKDIDNNAEVGLFDAGCVLAITLIANGHNPAKINVIEKTGESCYYEFAKETANKLEFNIITPPMNNYNRIDRKFDVILGNPPYKGQMHLEFLKLSLEKSDYVSFVHPSGWLTRSEKSIEKDVKKLLEGRLKSLTIFNGTPVFKCEFQAPLVITEVVKSWDNPVDVHYLHTNNSYQIDNIWDFPTGYWEPSEINLNLRDKIKKLADDKNLLSLRTSDINSVPLNLPSICGDPRSKHQDKLFRDDFYLFFYPNSNIYTHENNEGKFYSLNNEEERDNLVSYLKTKFARFALSLNKATNRNNVSRYIKNVPLPPLDQQWNDESVNSFFNITDEEWQSIDSFIPTYYKCAS